MMWYTKTCVKLSPIAGKGRFASKDIAEGARVVSIPGDIHKNENNSYVNHSLNNHNLNWDGAISWFANKDIKAGEEIIMNYRQWVTIEVPNDHWLDRAH